jgi:opine dehydrogenase
LAKVAILGGGNGGFAAAAHLQNSGHVVRLYNRSVETISSVAEAGGVYHRGVLGEGFAPIEVVTTSLAEAVKGMDLVMICLPATAFEHLAAELASVLDGSQPVLLNPGSTGGALAFRGVVKASGCKTIPPICETNTLTYICRKEGTAGVFISSLVRNVRFAILGEDANGKVANDFLSCYPTLRIVPNVLYTSMSNVNAVLHPPGLILAAAWIEGTGGEFRYYYDAATPAVAQVMADLDAERLAIASAWNISIEPFPELFADIGSTSREAGASGSFLRVMRESAPNEFIKAPSSLEHRYMKEDIPYGLVPLSELGRAAGVRTPVIDALITLASSISCTDQRARGWTLQKLGLPCDRQAAEHLL